MAMIDLGVRIYSGWERRGLAREAKAYSVKPTVLFKSVLKTSELNIYSGPARSQVLKTLKGAFQPCSSHNSPLRQAILSPFHS